LNERVAKANAFAKFLEKTLLERDADLVEARRALRGAASECENLRVMAADVQRELERGGSMNAGETKKRVEILNARLDRMSKALATQAKSADAVCFREVPVTYQGNASDVRLMGSFDDWTRGFHLSPEYVDDGDGFTDTFTATCMLAPGSYEVKFLVDGEWRTTDDWPTVGEGYARNMLLRVQ
jgi:hypothetical protein